MARKRDTPPVEAVDFDPNQPLSLPQLAAELEPDGDELPVPEPATAGAVAADPDAWPDVPWRAYDLMFLRYSEGRASGEEVTKIMEMGLSRDRLDRECSRVRVLKSLLPKLGSRSELARLREHEAAERKRVEAEKAAELQRFSQLQREHTARMRELDRQAQAATGAADAMQRAQDLAGERLPAVAIEGRMRARDTFKNSGADAELKEARSHLTFLRQMDAADYGSGRYLIPEEIWRQGHPMYIGPKPPVSRLAVKNESQEIGPQIKDAWDARRAEFAAQIPAAEAEVARLQAAYNAARDKADSQILSFSYVPE